MLKNKYTKKNPKTLRFHMAFIDKCTLCFFFIMALKMLKLFKSFKKSDLKHVYCTVMVTVVTYLH